MKRKYENENEIADLVRAFESATISREAWRHAEHMVVALYYLTKCDVEAAVIKMRDGIFRLLSDGFGVDLTKEMPYHETITVFWVRVVSEFHSSRAGTSLLDMSNELVDSYDKDYLLKFYSRELLFSDEARAKFVGPDLSVHPSLPFVHTLPKQSNQAL